MFTIPVTDLMPGQHTDDGQQVLDVFFTRDSVLVTVYTPRPDNPLLDARNMATPETRLFDRGDTINTLD